MKKTAIILFTMFSAACTDAKQISEKDVPAAVKASLQKQFPGAEKVKWEKENGQFEAGFEIKEAEYSLVIDPAGAILETDEEIDLSMLPAAAKTYVSEKFPGKEIKETTRITDAGGTTTYEAEVNGKDLIFNGSGSFIKESTEKKD